MSLTVYHTQPIDPVSLLRVSYEHGLDDSGQGSHLHVEKTSGLSFSSGMSVTLDQYSRTVFPEDLPS